MFEIKEVPSHFEEGQAMVEYALLLLVVAIAVLSFGGAADRVIAIYQYILKEVSSVLK
ncbi:hypothetical protein Psfp_03823 [Pelotomaculum sp. FP]|uniref:hypothetical protein n=1 Tax=Pelotomaculum sp. FP TaxID=261474 RepID=UPI001104F68C|nr:hypothetical protein [Pelotomaculum sp. FP]TEB12143.1 hypothetical protein Psfp_03823 [Pelotomaculum sp. FP]